MAEAYLSQSADAPAFYTSEKRKRRDADRLKKCGRDKPMPDRFNLQIFEASEDSLGSTVLSGLKANPKALPSRLFYDQRGSELFEQITGLPEYYLTRCETQILTDHGEEIVAKAGSELSLVEFGSGSSCKTRLMIEAILERQATLEYTPIDISIDFLTQSSTSLLQEYPRLSIRALGAEYFRALEALPTRHGPRLFLFLGSNIGNLLDDEAVAFLAGIRRCMGPHDSLLVGIDLVKDPKVLEAAYNDSAGITARFNMNVLDRIDRELGGHFADAKFEHRANWQADHCRIEMSLQSMANQCVQVEALDASFEFGRGEHIHTEWCTKYSMESFSSLAERAGLDVAKHWCSTNGWFAEMLLRRSR